MENFMIALTRDVSKIVKSTTIKTGFDVLPIAEKLFVIFRERCMLVGNAGASIVMDVHESFFPLSSLASSHYTSPFIFQNVMIRVDVCCLWPAVQNHYLDRQCVRGCGKTSRKPWNGVPYETEIQILRTACHPRVRVCFGDIELHTKLKVVIMM
jgi:hypothetical protein